MHSSQSIDRKIFETSYSIYCRYDKNGNPVIINESQIRSKTETDNSKKLTKNSKSLWKLSRGRFGHKKRRKARLAQTIPSEILENMNCTLEVSQETFESGKCAIMGPFCIYNNSQNLQFNQVNCVLRLTFKSPSMYFIQCYYRVKNFIYAVLLPLPKDCGLYFI